MAWLEIFAAHALLERLSDPKATPKLAPVSASTVISGSACQAGEPFRRMAVAVRALRRELPGGYAEDSGQLPDFPAGEAPLPSAAAAFGGAYGRGVRPAHQFAELCLGPPVALAQRADVHRDDDGLGFRELTGAVTPSRRHALVLPASIAKTAFPPGSGCQPQ